MEVAPASAVGLEQNSFFLDQTWHVLLCDDDPIVLKAVGLLLNKSGYRVTTASSGREALQLLEASKLPGAKSIDLVVTDLQMPELSGFDLLHEVLTGSSDVPIVVMSSSSDQAAVLQAFEAGAADYLIKPLRRNEVATLWQHVWRANRYKASVQHAAHTTQASGYANNHYVPQAPASGGNMDGSQVMAPVDHHRAAAHHPQNPATKAAAAAAEAGSLPAATGKNGSSGASTSHVDQGSTMMTSAAARGGNIAVNKANATANNATASTDPSHTATHTANQSTHQSGVHDSRMLMRSQPAEGSASAAKHISQKPSHREQGVACACIGPDCMDVDHDVDDDDDEEGDDDAEGRATSPITQAPIEAEQQLVQEDQSRSNKHQESQQQQNHAGHVSQPQQDPALKPAPEPHLHTQQQQQQQQRVSQQQQQDPPSAIFSAAHSMRTSFDANTHHSTGRQSHEYNATGQSKSRRRSSTSMAVVGAGPSPTDTSYAASQLPLALQELASIGLQRLDLKHNSSHAEASTATGTIIGGSVVSAARASDNQVLSQQNTQHNDAAEQARLEAERLKREQDELETAEAAGLLLGVAAAAAAEQEAARHAAQSHKSNAGGHGRNHGGRRGESSNGGHRSGSTTNQLSHSSRSAFSALTVILPRKASAANNGKAEQSQSQHAASGLAMGTPVAPTVQNSTSYKSPLDTHYDAVSPHLSPPIKLQPGKSQKGSSKLPDNIGSESEAKQQPSQQRSPGQSPVMNNANAAPVAALDNANTLPLAVTGSGPLSQVGEDMMPATGVPASGRPMYPMAPHNHLMLPQAVMPLLAYSFAGLPPEMAAMYMASAAQHAAHVQGQPHPEHQPQENAAYMEGMQHTGASHMPGMPGCATSMMTSAGGAPPSYPSVVVVAGRGTGCGLSNMSSSAVAHRKAAVARYLQKKNNRSFKKKVRYESRKRLAEARPRVRGQFVKQDVLLAMAGSAGSGSLPPAADSHPSGSSGTSTMGKADHSQKQQHSAMADMQSGMLPVRSSARVQARNVNFNHKSGGGSGGSKRQRLRRGNTQEMEDVGHEEEDDDVDDDNDDMQQASDDDDMDDEHETQEGQHASTSK